MATSQDEPMVDAPPLKPKRRFAPQLVEGSVRSSSKKNSTLSESRGTTTADNDVPMQDAPKTKGKRRFAPQLVEETVTRAGDRKIPINSRYPQTSTAHRVTTKDASVQVDDIEMSDAPEPHTRRRFAPVPIETTFDSYRVHKNPIGPTAELTPDPSPTSSTPPILQLTEPEGEKQPAAKRPKRRFAPQLIETSRRAKRAGQEGPATKPTDKTDITPGTNHIYAPKPKRRLRHNNAGLGKNEDDHPGLLQLTPRRQSSMKPHPNTRRATRTDSFHPELATISSGSDKEEENDREGPNHAKNSKDLVPPPVPTRRSSDGESWVSRNYETRDRRESCDESSSMYLLAVAAREAQRQRELEQAMSAFPNGLRIEGVEHFLVRDSSEDDHTEVEEEVTRHGVSGLLIRRKSTDPGWAVKEMRQHAEQLAKERERAAKGDKMSIDDMIEIAPPPEDPLWTTGGPRPEHHLKPKVERMDSKHLAPRPIDSAKSSPRIRPAVTPVRRFSPPAGPIPALVGGAPWGSPYGPSPYGSSPYGPSPYGTRSPFGTPYSAFNNAHEARELRRMRKAASPPMLGGDIKFRMCPSPKTTRMEPDHPYPTHGESSRPEPPNRDVTMETGLWRGYCVAQANEEAKPTALKPLALLATPAPAESPNSSDPFAAAFTHSMTISGASTPSVPSSPSKRHSGTRGLHLLSGLDDRLRREKARKDLEERIAVEFNDAFVTQVYNYLSLGYPATARAFDEELSKISGIDMKELRKNDHQKIEKGFMLDIEMKSASSTNCSSTDSCSNSSDGMLTPEEDERRSCAKPPRWKALKLYIREWARQHPNLNDDRNPLAWGVPARRGSWAI